MIRPVHRSVNLLAPLEPSGDTPRRRRNRTRRNRLAARMNGGLGTPRPEARGQAAPPCLSDLTPGLRRVPVCGIRPHLIATDVPPPVPRVKPMWGNDLAGAAPGLARSPAGANCRESRNLLLQFSKSDTDALMPPCRGSR